MKKHLRIIALILILSLMAVSMFACDQKEDPPTKEPPSEKSYYLTGSFNGYDVADEAYKLAKVSADSALLEAMPDADLYFIKVPAENMVPDSVYGQHYYKITAGNWDENYGTESYDLQPAAVYYDDAGNPTGLGSIFISGDFAGELLVVFDAKAHKIYDNTMTLQFSPRVYGDWNTSFGLKNDWDYSKEGAFEMTETADGVYSLTVDVPAYAAEGEGATLYVVKSAKCYMAVDSDFDYISWGALEQYIVAGAGAEIVKPSSASKLTITYTQADNAVSIKVD